MTNPSQGQYADYAIYAEKTGFGFSPNINHPAASVTKFDFNGSYRTVIRFEKLPTGEVSNISFSALRAGDKLANLPRTGQTTSYANGDDGDGVTRKGVAWPTQRFEDKLDGTVKDKLTGLIWLKNAGCFPASIWSTALTQANQLAHGQCGLSDSSIAGQWRMPNVNELESLVDAAHSQPAVTPNSGFTGINLSTAYWSSTTYTAGTNNAMAIRFSDSRWINGPENGNPQFDNVKASSNNMLWAVKDGDQNSSEIKLLATGVFNGPGGGSFGKADDAALRLGIQFPYPRFVDNGNGTIADTLTGLTWLKQANCMQQTWSDAIASINTLGDGKCGLSDGSTAGQWRMPNRNEMLSLSDRAPTFPQSSYFSGQYQGNGAVTGSAIFHQFITGVFYWSSTTNANDTSQAWTLYSCDFGVYNEGKSKLNYALAVR